MAQGGKRHFSLINTDIIKVVWPKDINVDKST